MSETVQVGDGKGMIIEMEMTPEEQKKVVRRLNRIYKVLHMLHGLLPFDQGLLNSDQSLINSKNAVSKRRLRGVVDTTYDIVDKWLQATFAVKEQVSNEWSTEHQRRQMWKIRNNLMRLRMELMPLAQQ